MLRRRRRETSWPAKLQVTLSPELTARVYQHHREGMLGGVPQDTVRDLLTAALDFPQVEDSLIRSARLRGFTVVKREFWDLAQALLAELDQEWQRQRNVATVPAEDYR